MHYNVFYRPNSALSLERQAQAQSGIDTRNAGNLNLAGFAIGAAGVSVYYDDLYICNSKGSSFNTFLGPIRIHALRPSGAGATTQLTPLTAVANYTTVDDVTPNITDYNHGSTAELLDTYALSNLPAPSAGANQVLAVKTSMYASKSADAPTKGAAIVHRHGGVNYDGPTVTLADGFQYFDQLLPTAPDGSAWDETKVNGLESGMRVKGL